MLKTNSLAWIYMVEIQTVRFSLLGQVSRMAVLTPQMLSVTLHV